MFSDSSHQPEEQILPSLYSLDPNSIRTKSFSPEIPETSLVVPTTELLPEIGVQTLLEQPAQDRAALIREALVPIIHAKSDERCGDVSALDLIQGLYQLSLENLGTHLEGERSFQGIMNYVETARSNSSFLTRVSSEDMHKRMEAIRLIATAVLGANKEVGGLIFWGSFIRGRAYCGDIDVQVLSVGGDTSPEAWVIEKRRATAGNEDIRFSEWKYEHIFTKEEQSAALRDWEEAERTIETSLHGNAQDLSGAMDLLDAAAANGCPAVPRIGELRRLTREHFVARIRFQTEQSAYRLCADSELLRAIEQESLHYMSCNPNDFVDLFLQRNHIRLSSFEPSALREKLKKALSDTPSLADRTTKTREVVAEHLAGFLTENAAFSLMSNLQFARPGFRLELTRPTMNPYTGGLSFVTGPFLACVRFSRDSSIPLRVFSNVQVGCAYDSASWLV